MFLTKKRLRGIIIERTFRTKFVVILDNSPNSVVKHGTTSPYKNKTFVDQPATIRIVHLSINK